MAISLALEGKIVGLPPDTPMCLANIASRNLDDAEAQPGSNAVILGISAARKSTSDRTAGNRPVR